MLLSLILLGLAVPGAQTAPAAPPPPVLIPPSRPAVTKPVPEPLCVFAGVLKGKPPEDDAAAKKKFYDAVIAECRARYGWNEATSQQAVRLAYAGVEMMVARSAALKAGVPDDKLSGYNNGVTPAEAGVLASRDPRDDKLRQIVTEALIARAMADGMTRDQAEKIADFQRWTATANDRGFRFWAFKAGGESPITP